ncbi:Ras-related protein Rab-7L1 [Acipenser ruthenus]|uniref:Ras-related protein Rab-7L1 n=1 Tax=Acipenser ruthenus TaxID=7906 RepID=A0A444V5Q3_ACIRT|nr:Ras-related protein Rab-7L1 [Acipenser ruthenus]
MGSRDYLFKVLVIGDREVGKTSLVQRYVNDKFSKHYKSTVGVDFAVKVIQWSDTETVRLQLWDIAGQERFASMTRIYYKEASGCFIVFDVMNPTTLNNSLKWKQDLDSKVMRADGSPVPCMLLANKICMERLFDYSDKLSTAQDSLLALSSCDKPAELQAALILR